MFSVSYIYVYYAERNVVSGLVAVGYSASPLLGMLGMRLFFRTPMTPAMIAGSILGIAGIALVFWPEFAHLRNDRRTALGALYTAVAVAVSALGSLVAHRNHESRLPLWQSMAYGMLYGSLFSFAVALATGRHLGFEATAGYVLSLLYLAVLGSIVAFAAYLTLLSRIGPARAGYIGVMVPIVALVLSAAFEGFHWQALTLVGIAICVAGNVIVLRRR
jgi:drug/metabolite transporter (DMT)-like permease